MIKAIETVYKGYRFRSRLEARWAVFFDALGVKWEYEEEGFIVGDGIAYLPDFYLPNNQIWVEVKGGFDNIDWHKLISAVDWNRGLPGTDGSFGGSGGLLILGNIPCFQNERCFHPILQHLKGVWLCEAEFLFHVGGGEISVATSNKYYADSSWGGDYDDIADATKQNINGRFIKNTIAQIEVRNAYDKARSARFEHGESGYQSK